MFLPFLLILLAAGAAAAFGYGMDSRWGQYPHGLDYIVLARRFQWLSAMLTILLSVSIITLVASGKRRIWWLLGLAPILLLFFHHFSTPHARTSVLDNPTFIPAAQATFLHDDEWVVGLSFNANSYAYPFSTLYTSPVISQIDRGKDNHLKRLLLMWSPYANRATAFLTKAEIRPRSLDIVSMPANALLIYNTRRGEFINALTGQTLQSQLPTGFISPIPTSKMRWADWRSLHPDTLVLPPTDGQKPDAPTAPLAPRMKMPPAKVPPDPDRRILLLATTRPYAILQEAAGRSLINMMAGDLPLLLVRVPHSSHTCASAASYPTIKPPSSLSTPTPRKKGTSPTTSPTAPGKSPPPNCVPSKAHLPSKRSSCPPFPSTPISPGACLKSGTPPWRSSPSRPHPRYP